MKNINFLIGSGIHLIGQNKKLPDTLELTNKILNFEIEEGIWIPKDVVITNQNKKRFINILFNKLKKYYTGYKINPTYEDIYFLIRQLIDDANGFKYNPAIDEFRKAVF